MTDMPLGREWAAEAQRLLLSLRDIVGADIRLSEDGRSLAEINVLAEGHRPPKQIVRDVRSALRAEYQVDVDYRKISVAQRREPEGGPPESGTTILSLPSLHVDEEPVVARLRFESISVTLDVVTCHAQVELSLEGRQAVGEAGGPAGGREGATLLAQATLEALAKFLDTGPTIALGEVKFVHLGGEEVVLVGVKFFKDRSEKGLVGACVVGPSLQQSVVYATLDALNRFLGRVRFRGPIEYEIRPASPFA
jgi:hypothetical protein